MAEIPLKEAAVFSLVVLTPFVVFGMFGLDALIKLGGGGGGHKGGGSHKGGGGHHKGGGGHH